jgi:hypothetical protein
VIIQIDGLAHPILAGRMRPGSVNTMAGMVRDGSHKLSRWEAILPVDDLGQPGRHPARQQRRHPGLPLVRARPQKLMVSSNPVDAGEIVLRVSDGEGLLSNNGASITNLVTGDATRAYFTTAAIKDKSQGIGESKAFLGFFLSPSGYLRSFTLFLGEFFKGAVPGAPDPALRASSPDAPRNEVRRHARREQRPASATSTRR